MHRTVFTLSSVLIDERVKDLLAQERGLVLVGLRLPAGRCVLQGALNRDCVFQDAQFETKVAVPGVVTLQGQEAQFPDGEPEVFELFDVESRSRGDRTGDEAGQHDEVAPRRKRELDAVSRGESLQGFGHEAPAAWSESVMVNTLVSPVISKIFMMRGSATTT